MGKDDSSRDALEEEVAKNEGDVRYSSRRLACTKCGTEQETKEKQLKIKNGFRAIVCNKCGKQERVHSHKCSCDIIWHHCLLHKNDPQQHLIKRKREEPARRNDRPQSKRDSQASTRVAPDIEDGNPSKAKRPSPQTGIRPLQGQMLDMQLRVRQKEAKRKEDEAVNVANKKRCEREERMTRVQLQAYWDTFPLPEQKLEGDESCGDHRDTEHKSLQRHVPGGECSRTASSNERHAFLDNLRTSIAERAAPDAKRIKLDPQNSWEWDDPVAVNRDVDLVTKDRMQDRIHNREPRANIKRACTFDELTQSCKTSKKEMRSILNICDTGRSR